MNTFNYETYLVKYVFDYDPLNELTSKIVIRNSNKGPIWDPKNNFQRVEDEFYTHAGREFALISSIEHIEL